MARQNPLIKISDIDGPDKWFDLECQVTSEVAVPVDSIAQKVWVADKTGACECVLWQKAAAAGVPKLKKGKSYRLSNVVSNEFRGTFSIALVRTTTVEEIADLGMDEELY